MPGASWVVVVVLGPQGSGAWSTGRVGRAGRDGREHGMRVCGAWMLLGNRQRVFGSGVAVLASAWDRDMCVVNDSAGCRYGLP